MKCVLLCLIITCSTYIGYGFSSYYRKRLRLFKDCHNFANKLIVDINFSKNNLKEIISSSLGNYGSEFKQILNRFLDYLNSHATILKSEDIFVKNNFLSVEEIQVIFTFLKGLGRYDAENQIKELEDFKLKFDELKQQANNENKKYGALYVKLGLMFGIMLAILLI